MPYLSSWTRGGKRRKENFVNVTEPPYHDPAGRWYRRWSNESQPAPEVEPRRWEEDWTEVHPQTPIRTKVPKRVRDKVKPVFEEGRLNRSVTADLPEETWGEDAQREPSSTIVEIPDDDSEEEMESIEGLGHLGKFKMPKALRGKSANRIINVVAGPLAPVAQAVRAAALGKKSSIAKGNIKIPKAALKVVKQIPVVNKLPGVNRGYISPKMLLSPKILVAPVKAVAAQLREKKKVVQQQPATQTSAEAISYAADQVAEETGQSSEQVIENPETSGYVSQQAQYNLQQAQASIEQQIYDDQQEQAIRQAEMQQVSGAAQQSVVPGARTKDQIMEEMQAIAIDVLQRQGIEPTDENIAAVSETVYEQWMEGQADEIDAAQAEQEYLQAEYTNAQAAQSMLKQMEQEGGFEGLRAFMR